MYNFCVLSEKKVRVDIYLSALFSLFSRSYIQKMIDKWQVLVNWKTISKNIKINPKDEIKIIIKTEKLNLEPQKMDLDIIFEDENLLIINKDPWINVHPVPWEWWKENTLVNGILYHCGNTPPLIPPLTGEGNNKILPPERGELEGGVIKKLPSINWVERPGIVHRLDKDTSGIILIAKTDFMMRYLSDIIKERKIKKEYIAVVSWIIKDKKIKIESYIWRDPNDRKKMTHKSPINPKLALTEAEVLDYIDWKYTILKVRILTWRTHQIRVHLSSIWHPIIWDKVYGNEKINKEVFEKFWLKRQALHAKKLEFNLYSKNVVFEAELKKDILRIFKEHLKNSHLEKNNLFC